ncbi:MAG: SDR family NAD(P)-dependent oxidoreductase [Acidobacteriota bacterium]
MWNMQGKVAVITGAGNGIGLGSARIFARQGAKVVLLDVEEKAGRDVEEALQREGCAARFIRTDVSKVAEVAQSIESVIAEFGQIDVLFANAAVQLSMPVESVSEEDWDRLHDVNVKGVFLCCQYVLPWMKRRKSGAIVITSSGHALVTYPNCSAYASTKGALVSFMRALALECAADGVRVNCVLPGTTDTRLVRDYIGSSADPADTERRLLGRIPLKRLAQPEDIGYAVLFLVSDYAAFITGTSLVVDGGQLAQG